MSNFLTSVVSLGVRASGSLIQLAISWLIVRIYGANSVGEFFFGLMLVTGLSIIVKQGEDIALVQYLPGRDISTRIKGGVVAEIIRAVIVRSIIVTALSVTAVWIIADTHIRINLSVMLLSLAGMSVTMVISEYLKAEGKIIQSGVLQYVIGSSVAVMILLIFLYLDQYGINLENILAAEHIWVIVWSLLLFIQVAFIYKLICRKHHEEVCGEVGEIRRVGKEIFKVNALGFSIGWMDIILSNFIYGALLISVYSIANKISLIGAFIAIAITSVYGRQIAIAYKEGDMVKLKRIYIESHRAAIIIGAPLLSLLIIFRGEIMGFWGEEFSSMSDILILMIIGQNALLIFGPSNYTMLMTQRGGVLKNIYMTGVAIMISMGVYFSETDNIYTVALITSLVNISINATSYVYVRKKIFKC